MRLLAQVEGSTSIGPGFTAFLVMFALAIAVLVLIRSMTHHLRKVRYGPDPADRDGADGADGGSTPTDRPD